MDEKPFLEINLLHLERSPIAELKKLTKSAFNIEEMLPAAWELKYTNEFKRSLYNQLQTPSDESVCVLARETYSGVINSKRLEQFREITHLDAAISSPDHFNDFSKTADSKWR